MLTNTLQRQLKFFTLLLIFGACSPFQDGELGVEIPDNTAELLSITKNFYHDNTLVNSTKYNFENGLLTDINIQNSSSKKITYSNGLLTQVDEYDANKVLEWTRTYDYDSFGRLIAKTSVPKDVQWEIEVKEFEYKDDQIIATQNFYDHDSKLLFTGDWILTLGANNLIIQEESANEFDHSGQKVEYSNLNPASFTQYGFGEEIDATISYSFSTNKAVESYHLTKFMFGKEWKNNTILDQQFSLDHEVSSTISDDYLLGYSFKIDASKEIIESLIVKYEFAGDKLLKQTKLLDKRKNLFKTEFLYEYRDDS